MNKENVFYFYSTGCPKTLGGLNKLKSDLNNLGVRITEDESQATHIIYRPCTFQNSKLEISQNVIRKFLDAGKNVIVTGCVVPLVKWCEENNVLVCQNPNFKMFFIKNFPNEIGKVENQIINFGPYVQVSEGCHGDCAYCMISKVEIGKRYWSIPREQIFTQTEMVIKNGHKMIILGGDDLTPYGCDLYGNSYGLPELLMDVKSKYPDVEIAIANLNIRYAKEWNDSQIINVIECVRNGNLHLPLQSGDDNVLEHMKRLGYKRKDFIDLHSKIYSYGGTVGTDFIVGFPGETDEQFENTLDIIRNYCLEFVEIFGFEPMPDTEAASMPNQISEHIKYERMKRCTYEFIKKNPRKNAITNRAW